MTPVAVTVAVGVGALVLGVLVGYLLGRRRRRRGSSVALGGGNGAPPRGRRGRHRGGQ